MQVDGQGTHAAWPTDDIHVSRPSDVSVSHRATPMQVDDQGTTPVSVNERVSSNSALPVQREHAVHQPPTTEVESSFSTRRENIEPLPFSATTESSVYMDTENATFSVPIPNESVKTTPIRVTEEAVIVIERPSPVAISDDEDFHMVAAEDNHHFASGRSSESPFMYLSTLSAKWAETKDQVANVEGKIKCFVTGVERFQYKERSTYKLHVYVDDGSLISEILIDHRFVQKKIGYSRVEAIALSKSAEMKSRMKEFQEFLANFEGTMVLRFDESSSLPTALDLQQGCPPADAWSLLARLKPRNDVQRSQLEPIDLSP